MQIEDLTLKHKISRKKLSDAAGKSGEFSKQSIKLNAEIESLQNIINPLAVKKRKVEEDIIQNNIQKDEISSQIKALTLEKQKLLESLTIKDKIDTLENIISFYLHEVNFTNQTVQ